MALLGRNDVKSELSYAYLHAIAARAGIGCEATPRHTDNAGVDAVLRAKERFSEASRLTNFTIEVQLKATSTEPRRDAEGRYPFVLSIEHYDKLRDVGAGAQQILVVLFMPPDEREWLSHSSDALVARRCAYWTSLRGLPESPNVAAQTVYLPESNAFSVEAVRSIFQRRSLGGWIGHDGL